MAVSKEKIEYWALLAEIVAAVGVIISVVYLAVQVGDGNTELRAQTHNNLLNQFNAPFMELASNNDLAEIVAKGLKDPDALSDERWLRFNMYQLVSFNAWEYAYYLNSANSTTNELWLGANAWYSEEARIRPGLRRFWKETGIAYAEPFYSYVDSLVNEHSHSQTAKRHTE